MQKILDSNIWISYFIIDDSNHKKASKIIEWLENESVCITDHIIIEVSTILLYRLWKQFANDFIELIKYNTNVGIFYSNKIIFDDFINFFIINKNNKLSFVDQSLIYLSKDFEIITFDKEINKELWN